MTIIIDNWAVVIGCASVLAIAGMSAYSFFNLPTAEKMKKVKEWLIWATFKAEEDLGSGTGRLKLRKVYDLFITKFPDVAKVLTFDMYADLVDDALEELRKILESNPNAKELIKKYET